MLDVYGVWSPQRDALIQLCRDARRRGWWTAYADVFTGSYIAMEAEASSIRIHAHVLMPGIFQVPATPGRSSPPPSRASAPRTPTAGSPPTGLRDRDLVPAAS